MLLMGDWRILAGYSRRRGGRSLNSRQTLVDFVQGLGTFVTETVHPPEAKSCCTRAVTGREKSYSLAGCLLGDLVAGELLKREHHGRMVQVNVTLGRDCVEQFLGCGCVGQAQS